MDHFALDWRQFIDWLPVWEGLPLAARRVACELDRKTGMATAELEGFDRCLAEAGLVRYRGRGRGRVAVLPPVRQPFSRALRAMYRHPIDLPGADGIRVFYGYIQENFTRREIALLCSHLGCPYDDNDILYAAVQSARWVEAFADEQTDRPRAAARPGLPWLGEVGPPPCALPPPPLARRLVEEIRTLDAPLPLGDIPRLLGDPSADELNAAIRSAVGWLVVFPRLRADDLMPVLGLWPSVTKRLHRSKVEPPAAVQPAEVFRGSVLMEDMTALLAQLIIRPARLRGDGGGLFAKVRAELEQQLVACPPWLGEAFPYFLDARVDRAQNWLEYLGLSRTVGTAGVDLQLEATARGEAYLARAPKDRLRILLDVLRNFGAVSASRDGLGELPEEMLDPFAHPWLKTPTDFISPGLRVSDRKKGKDVFRRLTAEAFATIPAGTFVRRAEFILWQSRECCPLGEASLEKEDLQLKPDWGHVPATEEERETAWGKGLRRCLQDQLLPFGGIEVARCEEGDEVAFALTAAGRYLLGLVDDFEYEHRHEAEGQIVVQPNFEVVFLGPAPLAEAAVARFAERQRRGVGTLFAITREAILAAAATGLSAADVLDTLAGLSAKPVPDNVACEIRNWSEKCRRVRAGPAFLIRCPDAETAARVLTVGGPAVAAVTETVVELTDLKARDALLRKLMTWGIFAEGSAHGFSGRGTTSRAGKRSRHWRR